MTDISQYIDLRSDTVTLPTREMRQAMAHAEVGDDVYGEDPTVNRLEATVADLFGQEAALLVTSGTQGNLVAMLTHLPRGSEVILGDRAHIFLYEQGGLSALGGIIPYTVPVQQDGSLRIEDIEKAIRVDNVHFARTRAIALENTQGTVGGVPLSPAYVRQVADLAHERGLSLHIDGARIFNAATHFDASPAEMMAGADSLTFCLSKGLGAPMGSLLVGSRAFIQEARRARKILGGGLRQAGIVAAAGLIAVEKMTKRLQRDHDNAAYLAEKIGTVPHLELVSQHTNFVFFQLKKSAAMAPEELSGRLLELNIRINPYHGSDGKFRAVLHHWIDEEQIDRVICALKRVLG